MHIKKKKKSKKQNHGFESEIVEKILITRFSCNLMGGKVSEKFYEAIDKNLEKNIKKFIINLNEVTYINSVGLGMFIRALTTIKNAGGIMYLCHIDKIESIFKTSRLINVFLHTENEKEAIKMIHKSH